MKKISILLVLAALAFMGISAPKAVAKEKQAKAAANTDEFRWHGRVVRSNSEQSTLTVRRGRIERTVHYGSSTTWTKDNKPSDASAVKDGDSVIVQGKFNDKKELEASRIEIRPPHMVP